MSFDKDYVESLYPGAASYVMSPMLIKLGNQKQIEEACSSDDWYLEEKIDGYLGMFVRGDNGQNYYFGRTISQATKLPTEKVASLPQYIEAFKNIPNGTVILGETYMPNGTSKNVTTILGCLSEKAIKRQEETPLHFYIYDLLFLKGEDLRGLGNWERKQKLIELYNDCKIDSPYIHLAPHWIDNKSDRINEILQRGGEGGVLKYKNATYEEGKRPKWNLKVKQVDYLDAFIIGYEPPTKEYYGKEIENWQYWVDSFDVCCPIGVYKQDSDHIPVTRFYWYNWKNTELQIGVYDDNKNIIKIGTIHSGLNDELREGFSNYPEKYLNKVVKIQCMSFDKENLTIRHGFFRGFRDDKNAEDCLLKDITN